MPTRALLYADNNYVIAVLCVGLDISPNTLRYAITEWVCMHEFSHGKRVN